VVSVVGQTNEVNQRCVRVTVFGHVNPLGTVCNQPTRSTQISMLPGSVNEDHICLERQRQVWFIPFLD